MSETLERLKPLFDRARREGLWFYTSYQGLWFSPDELANAQANGRFKWGPTNWELRDPKEYLATLENGVEKAEKELHVFRTRMQGAT